MEIARSSSIAAGSTQISFWTTGIFPNGSSIEFWPESRACWVTRITTSSRLHFASFTTFFRIIPRDRASWFCVTACCRSFYDFWIIRGKSSPDCPSCAAANTHPEDRRMFNSFWTRTCCSRSANFLKVQPSNGSRNVKESRYCKRSSTEASMHKSQELPTTSGWWSLSALCWHRRSPICWRKFWFICSFSFSCRITLGKSITRSSRITWLTADSPVDFRTFSITSMMTFIRSLMTWCKTFTPKR